MVGKMMPVPYKSNEKYKEFEYNFLLICRYLDLVTPQSRMKGERHRLSSVLSL
jgi:hypothetical protein